MVARTNREMRDAHLECTVTKAAISFFFLFFNYYLQDFIDVILPFLVFNSC